MTCKAFFLAATAAATIFLCSQQAWSADDFADIKEQITKQHDQSVKRLQDWIHQGSIAAETRVCGRRRRRNRLAPFSADRASAGSTGGVGQMRRRFHSVGGTGPRWNSDFNTRGEGRDRS